MLDHRARVAIHRHIRRAAQRGRIVQVAQFAAAVAKKYNIAESEAEAEIVSQAVLEDVGLQLGRDLPTATSAAPARLPSDLLHADTRDRA